MHDVQKILALQIQNVQTQNESFHGVNGSQTEIISKFLGDSIKLNDFEKITALKLKMILSYFWCSM